MTVQFPTDNLPRPTPDLVQAKSDLERWGLCMVADAISSDLLARVRARLYAEVEDDERLGWGKGISGGFDKDATNVRVWGLLNRGRCFAELVENQQSIELLVHLLGKDFLLSSISANVTTPGHQGGMLHADQQFVPEPWPAIPQGANAFWCVDAFTAENGGTLWAPASHKLNRQPTPAEISTMEMVPLEAPAGTLCVMDSRVYHATGPNRTADQRRAGIFGWYSRGIYRTQENWFVSLNPMVLQSASDTLKLLLGYKAIGGFGLANGSTDLFLTRFVHEADK